MITQIPISEFLSQSAECLTIDVRSEGEFNDGHIPYALNLPLFNNAERKTVGILYKQQGKEPAILQGLDIVGAKMSGFVQWVKPLAKDNKIFIHCWRGGMRSGSMAWLFSLFQYDVYVLQGGYKAYRNAVSQNFEQPYQLRVIGGRTGSGKTELLHRLQAVGEQVIDLEGLANHKGSAFGSLGQEPQPRSEHFENLLQRELNKLNPNKPVWIEDESRAIGCCFIPAAFWQQMRTAPLYVLHVPFETRVKRLVQDYAESNVLELEESLYKIQKRIGNEALKLALEKLHERDFAEVARITLHYYDKAYDYGLQTKETKTIYNLSHSESITKIIAQILQLTSSIPL